MPKLILKHYKLFYEKYNMKSLKYVQTVICSLIIHNIDNTLIQNLLLLLSYICIHLNTQNRYVRTIAEIAAYVN